MSRIPRTILGRGPPIKRSSRKPNWNTFFDTAHFGDLSNAIHAIFQSHNFIEPSINYETLENSLRLASRFMTTDHLLPWWNMVLHGPIEVAENDNEHQVLEPVPDLSSEQKVKVIHKLELLAQCVTFGMEKNYWTQGDTGYTERLIHEAPSPFQGVRTHISISKQVFEKIDRSFAEPDMENESRLWSHFLLANLLLHELTHAAMHAAHPRPPAHDPIQAYFLPGARTTEEGMEWETFVFGGLLYEIPSFLFWDRKKGLLGSNMVLREWPNPRLVANYRKRVYPRPFPVKGDLPESDRLWTVEPRFFERLFTTAFWDNDLKGGGRYAFHPERTGRFVIRGPLGLLVPEPERDKQDCANVHSSIGSGTYQPRSAQEHDCKDDKLER